MPISVGSMVGMLVPVKGGIGSIWGPPEGKDYKWYISGIYCQLRGLYATYHLLREPIDLRTASQFSGVCGNSKADFSGPISSRFPSGYPQRRSNHHFFIGVGLRTTDFQGVQNSNLS